VNFSPHSVQPGRFFILLAVIAGVAVTLGSIGWPDKPSANVGSPVKDGKVRKQAPDFELKDVNGKVVRLSDRGFTVLGVSMDDGGWKDVKPFVAEQKINYQIVLGDDKTSDQYGDVEALPTTFVIDREGRIASVHVGLADKKEFDDAIQKLL